MLGSVERLFFEKLHSHTNWMASVHLCCDSLFRTAMIILKMLWKICKGNVQKRDFEVELKYNKGIDTCLVTCMLKFEIMKFLCIYCTFSDCTSCENKTWATPDKRLSFASSKINWMTGKSFVLWSGNSNSSGALKPSGICNQEHRKISIDAGNTSRTRSLAGESSLMR